MMTDRTKLIAYLNDQFREGQSLFIRLGAPKIDTGKYVESDGIRELKSMQQLGIFAKTRDFGRYKDNVFLNKEHDKGQFYFDEIDRDIIWSIDYYDNEYRYPSQDPTDLSKTKRVITVMFAPK